MTKQHLTASLLILLLLPLSALAIVPSPPELKSSGYILVDMDSDQVLAEKNADQRMQPASLTKIMTAHVVFDALRKGTIKLSDMVLISKKAWQTGGSRMFINVGSRVSVENLLRGLIVDSGNDAAVALSEYVGGSEDTFVQMMNQEAARLGMINTHFMNATGLPHKDHYTSPRDLEKVTEATIRQYPKLYKLYSEKEFTWNKITQKNRNTLLWTDPSVDGVKTGHTKAAGYCLVASAKRHGDRLISVVMGTPSWDDRLSENEALLNYGFRFFETHHLYKAGDTLAQARVWKGAEEHVPLGITQELYVTIPRGDYSKLKARTEIKPNIEAPVAKGAQLGAVVVELDGKQIKRVPLVALKSDPEGGLWRRMVDTIKQKL